MGEQIDVGQRIRRARAARNGLGVVREHQPFHRLSELDTCFRAWRFQSLPHLGHGVRRELLDNGAGQRNLSRQRIPEAIEYHERDRLHFPLNTHLSTVRFFGAFIKSNPSEANQPAGSSKTLICGDSPALNC